MAAETVEGKDFGVRGTALAGASALRRVRYAYVGGAGGLVGYGCGSNAH